MSYEIEILGLAFRDDLDLKEGIYALGLSSVLVEGERLYKQGRVNKSLHRLEDLGLLSSVPVPSGKRGHNLLLYFITHRGIAEYCREMERFLGREGWQSYRQQVLGSGP